MSGNELPAASLAALRFTGERFDRLGVPVDVLPEATACQHMISDLARQLCLRDHPERTRVPDGFKAMSRIRVTAIREGSSTLVLEAETDRGPLAIGDTYVELAAEELQRVLAAVSSGSGVAREELDFRSCKQFGKTLGSDETLNYTSASGRSTELDHDAVQRPRMSHARLSAGCCSKDCRFRMRIQFQTAVFRSNGTMTKSASTRKFRTRRTP